MVQTINIAPHQVIQRAGDNGGGVPRPAWFWEDVQYGGILCDIGSHQMDQFLFYTGSTSAECRGRPGRQWLSAIPIIRISRISATWMLKGDKGFGYVRLDWFTPDGLEHLG